MKTIAQLGRSVGIATGAQLAGRLANVAVSLLVIAMVGATAQTDVFFFILALSFYFYGVLANAVTQATVGLILSRTLFLKPVHVVVCGSLTAICVAAFAGLINRIVISFPLPYIAAMGLLSGAGIANGLAAAYWQVEERFVFPDLSWSLRLIPLGAWFALGAGGDSLAWLGVGIGMADVLRCTLMLGGPGGPNQRKRQRPLKTRTPNTSAGQLKSLIATYGAVIIAAAISGLNPIIDRMIADLGGPGSISVIETGERIYMVLAGLATIGMATVLLPRLSRDVEDKTLTRNWPAVLKFVGAWSAAWLVAGWLAGLHGVGGWLTHSTNLTKDAVNAAQWVYWYYLMGLPFYALALVYVKRLQALRRWRVMVFTSGISVALNIPASLLLFNLLGVPAIALATSCIHLLNCAILIWAAHAPKDLKL